MDTAKIIIGKGFEQVKFGLSIDEVITILGETEKKWDDQYPDETISTKLKYEEKGFILGFDSEEDYRLTDIYILSSKILFDTKVKVGDSRVRLLDTAKKRKYGDAVSSHLSTEEKPNQELLEFEDIGTNFYINNNKVEVIQVSPLWVDEENIKWPE